jgi:DNA-directed RNA polymerase alpha subunit
MVSYEEFLKALQVINEYKSQVESDYTRLRNHSKSKDVFFEVPTKETLIRDADISRRAINVLASNDFYHKNIGDLENYTIKDLSKMRNMGKKTLSEIKQLCNLCGFSLRK